MNVHAIIESVSELGKFITQGLLDELMVVGDFLDVNPDTRSEKVQIIWNHLDKEAFVRYSEIKAESSMEFTIFMETLFQFSRYVTLVADHLGQDGPKMRDAINDNLRGQVRKVVSSVLDKTRSKKRGKS